MEMMKVLRLRLQVTASRSRLLIKEVQNLINEDTKERKSILMRTMRQEDTKEQR